MLLFIAFMSAVSGSSEGAVIFMLLHFFFGSKASCDEIRKEA